MKTMDLPLHSGHCPRWLFARMVKLSGLIAEAVVAERGARAFMERLSDPLWFQAFSCAIGFDWHSSGTTTVTMGALKKAMEERETGITVLGGKGKAMRFEAGERIGRASRLAFRTDYVALQDGYAIYHHSLVTDGRDWAIIQQGMRDRWARRYHWFSTEEFLDDGRTGLAAQRGEREVMDLSSGKSRETRDAVIDLVNDEGSRLSRYAGTLMEFSLPKEERERLRRLRLKMPRDIDWQRLNELKERQLQGFEEMLFESPKLVRALSLIAHLIYGTEISWRDPVHYTYAFGGKDGVPYPVDRDSYDRAISYLREVVEGLDISRKERLKALSRLDRFVKW